MFCIVAQNKNMIFINASFELLPKISISLREKIISIQEVSNGVVQPLPGIVR
jgi:hypothetical protein